MSTPNTTTNTTRDTTTQTALHLVCSEQNDLMTALTDPLAERVCRHDTVDEMIEQVRPGDGAAILSDSYPVADRDLSADASARLREANVRLYIEYPREYPGLNLAEPVPTHWERTVVSSSFFEPALSGLRILVQHGCWYLPVAPDESRGAGPQAGPQGSAQPGLPPGPQAGPQTGPQPECHLSVAKVAGYDEAVYGLPAGAAPILIGSPNGDRLIALSCLSRFITARYAPSDAWTAVWRTILSWVLRSDQHPELDWRPIVRATYADGAVLPPDAESSAFERSVGWLRSNAIFSVDTRKGVMEGFESAVDHMGRQFPRFVVRGDCTAESAMVLAYHWQRTRNPDSRRVAESVLDHLWLSDAFYQSDPNSPAYGHMNWNEGNPVFYGDDNARVIIPSLTAARLLDTDRWNDRILHCICANYRTTGPGGFRRARLDLSRIIDDGRPWMFYRDHDLTHFAPHYQAYLWATLLWAYELTGYRDFLEKPRKAIRMTMDRFPKWRWTNGLTQEMARMLLPLAFLVRVEDTDEHRALLMRMVDELLADMHDSGAILERMGEPDLGQYPSPRSNEDYGTSEAAVIQKNGDPCCDIFYATGFAVLGLHEAAFATSDPKIREAEDRLVDFLLRAQVSSRRCPFVDGTWMRAFDVRKWEYWGSSADLGWGAWCVEAGWYYAWITAVAAMRLSGESLFQSAWDEGLSAAFPAVIDEMLEEREFDPTLRAPAFGNRMPGAE